MTRQIYWGMPGDDPPDLCDHDEIFIVGSGYTPHGGKPIQSAMSVAPKDVWYTLKCRVEECDWEMNVCASNLKITVTEEPADKDLWKKNNVERLKKNLESIQ